MLGDTMNKIVKMIIPFILIMFSITCVSAYSNYEGIFIPKGDGTYDYLSKSYVTVGHVGACDYLTSDYSSDGEAIQAAINFTASNGGGTIFIRAGEYKITTTLIVPKDSGVTILGERMSKLNTSSDGTILTASGTITNLISMSGDYVEENADLNHDFCLQDLTIYGNSSVTNLIYLKNQDYVRINTCRLISATNIIKTEYDGVQPPTAGSIPGGIFINNCIFGSSGGYSIRFDQQTQCWVSNSWFASATTTSNHIIMDRSNKVKISNCEFNAATDSIFLFDDDADEPYHDITISGCVLNNDDYWNITGTNANSGKVNTIGNVYTQSTGAYDVFSDYIPIYQNLFFKGTSQISFGYEDTNISAPSLGRLEFNSLGKFTYNADTNDNDAVSSVEHEFYIGPDVIIQLKKDTSIYTTLPLRPAHVADTVAVNDTIYFSTTQDKLVYKNSTGYVNALY